MGQFVAIAMPDPERVGASPDGVTPSARAGARQCRASLGGSSEWDVERQMTDDDVFGEDAGSSLFPRRSVTGTRAIPTFVHSSCGMDPPPCCIADQVSARKLSFARRSEVRRPGRRQNGQTGYVAMYLGAS